MSTWKSLQKNVHLNGMFAASIASKNKQNDNKEGSQTKNISKEQKTNFNPSYDTTFAGNYSTTDTLTQKYGGAYTTFATLDTLENRYSFRRENDERSNNNSVEEKKDKRTDNQDAPEKITDVLKAFCSETSAHGLPHIVKDSGWSLWSIVWFVLFLGAIFGEFYHLSRLIEQYLEYPSVDSFRVSDEEPKFPAVTVCNTDPFSDLGYWNIFDTQQFDEYYNFAGTVPTTNADGDSDYAFYNRVNSPKGIFENVNRTELIQLGHQVDQFVMFCAYRGIECDYIRDFVLFEDPYYLNCYTYHIPDNIKDVDTGPDKGITFVFFLEGNPNDTSSDLYFTRDSFTEQTAGIKIELHEKNTLPNPTISGVDVLPGHSTSFALKENEREIAGNPYSKCTKRKTLADLNEYKYSTQRCYDVCKSTYVFNLCGCVNPDSPIPDSLRNINTQYCGTHNDSITNATESIDQWISNVQCEKDARLSFTASICDDKEYHSCPEACKYEIYDVFLSSLVWPSVPTLIDTYYDFVDGWKARTLLYDAFDDARNGGSIAPLRDLMWYNLARVNIFFNDPKVTIIKEVPSISIYDLFANIGGTVGLWAGLSVITMIEFLTLPFQILHFFLKRFVNRKKVGSVF